MRELLSLPGLPKDAIYKDVVVIGNGPSGISVSYQLAGNWAYLRPGTTHPEPMLEARLRCAPAGRPLALQALSRLAEGLEGRSTNPVPLLVDSLMHPGADMGSDSPSMLEWKYFPERQIDHVVLGRGRYGGLWRRLDPAVSTLSPARWMALPAVEQMEGAKPTDRVSVRSVADYYEKYVQQTGIQRYFRNNTIVTAVKPIRVVGKTNPGSEAVAQPITAAWSVSGYDTVKMKAFQYVCSRVVLATGASDRPNQPEPRGAGLRGAVRTPPRLQRALHLLERAKERAGENPLPVLVIGSGLSAADAILRLKNSGLPVAHAYRGASSALRSLPPALYPEYHQIHEMMKTGVSGNNPLYTALPDHVLLEIRQDGKIVEVDEPEHALSQRTVKLLNTKTNETIDIDVSLCVILIGSRPDLNFLPEDFENSCITWNLDLESVRSETVPISNGKKEQTFEMSLKDTTNGKLMPHPTEMCIKCSYKNQNRRKPENTYNRSCFLKTQWCNLKYIISGLQRNRQDERTDECDSDEDIEDCEMVVENGAKYEDDDVKINNIIKRITDDDSSDGDADEELVGCGLGLGVSKDKPIDCRNNPIAIDRESHVVVNAPKGLYALGPLAGDNFVRFIPGGALAIVSHIWNEKKLEESIQN